VGAVIAAVLAAVIVSRYNLDKREAEVAAASSAHAPPAIPLPQRPNVQPPPTVSTDRAEALPQAQASKDRGLTHNVPTKDVPTSVQEPAAPTSVKPCAYVEFETRAGDETVHLGLFGRYPPGDEPGCAPALTTDMLGGEFDPNRMRPLSDTGCNWKYLKSDLGLDQLACIEFSVRPGLHIIRLPSAYAKTLDLRAVLDLHRANGEVAAAVGADPPSFRIIDEYNLARIWYSREEMPEVYLRTKMWWQWISR
jgi:hypothetical protein